MPPLHPYLPIAMIAAVDALCGGLRAQLDGIFNDKVFVVSCVSNVVVAAVIAFLGDQLGVGGQLSTGVVVVRHPHLLQRSRHPPTPVPRASTVSAPEPSQWRRLLMPTISRRSQALICLL